MEKLIRCLTEIEQLKLVDRGLNVGNRKESTAEHSWSCMLIADILLDYVEPLNRLKVLEYLLYHDVVEVYAGDSKFNNPEEVMEKEEKEEAAMKEIIKLMPNSNRYVEIMTEYEQRTTREAEFAKAIDCIDACIRSINDYHKVPTDGFTEQLIRNKYIPHVSKFTFIHELFEVLMSKLKDQKKI